MRRRRGSSPKREAFAAEADGLQAVVGSSGPAAVPQELGMVRMPPRPLLVPVAAGMGEEVARAVGAATAAIRGGNPDANGTDDDLSGGGLAGNDPPNRSGAGAGASSFTSNANVTGVDGPLSAASGASPDRFAPNLFVGPGKPADNYIVNVADGSETARDFIARNCRGMILREFPRQCLDMTVDEIIGLKSTGDAAGRKAWKLLNDNRFRK